jgi:hypothetical protein
MTAASAMEYAQGLAESIKELDTAEEFDAFEWLEGVLDVSKFVGSDGEVQGVELLVAFGGPNAWVTIGSGSISAPGPDWVKVSASWYSDLQHVEFFAPNFAESVLAIFQA